MSTLLPAGSRASSVRQTERHASRADRDYGIGAFRTLTGLGATSRADAEDLPCFATDGLSAVEVVPPLCPFSWSFVLLGDDEILRRLILAPLATFFPLPALDPVWADVGALDEFSTTLRARFDADLAVFDKAAASADYVIVWTAALGGRRWMKAPLCGEAGAFGRAEFLKDCVAKKKNGIKEGLEHSSLSAVE